MRLPLRLLVFTAVSSTMVSSQQSAMTNAPTNFGAPSLYELLQRQNQLNNALLLNHALISNQMAAGLTDNHLHTPPTFSPFPQQGANLPPLLYPQHMQGLLPQNIQGSSAEKLAIYDALSPMGSPKSTEIGPIPIPVTPVVSGVVQVPVGKPEELIFFTPNGKKEKEKDLIDDPKAILKVAELEKVLTSTVSTEDSSLLTSTTPIQKATTMNHALSILKNLNLTESESEKLVQLVEQVVREELAKKLATTQKVSLSPTNETILLPAVSLSSSTTETPTTASRKIIGKTTPNAQEETSSVEETTHAFAGPTDFTQGPIDHSDRLLESEIPEIKLHPPKRVEEKDESYIPIKTSETHLTAIERAAEEEEREREAARKRYNKVTVSFETGGHEAGPTTVKPSTTTEPFDPSKVKPIPRRSYLETDSDLLALATGAPLDLSDETTAEEAAYRNRFRATKAPSIVHRITKPAMPPRLRPSTPPSQFVRLAADYRQRLSNSEDVTKLLKNFYENAFIQLVPNEVNPPRKVEKKDQISRR